MAGARLAQDIWSSEGSNVRWRVVVWDDAFSGTSMDYTIEADGFKLTYDDESDDIIYPLRPSSARVVFYNDGSTEFNSMVTDMAEAQEDRFKLLIYRHDGSNFNLYWAGLIMTDLIEWDNTEASESLNLYRPFEITAKDGLNRLANIEFDKLDYSPYISGGISTPQNLIKIIVDCLSYADTSQFWSSPTAYGNSGAYIKVNTTWKDANMVCDNSTAAKKQTRSLEITRIDRDFLFDHYEDTKDDYKYQNRINTGKRLRIRGVNDPALKVKTLLENVLQIMGLRMILSDGTFTPRILNRLPVFILF
jgi:hypothetical protein